jgi:hypothetical protein
MIKNPCLLKRLKIIIEMVHHSNEVIKFFNLFEKSCHDYTYLSNLFSEVQGLL